MTPNFECEKGYGPSYLKIFFDCRGPGFSWTGEGLLEGPWGIASLVIVMFRLNIYRQLWQFIATFRCWLVTLNGSELSKGILPNIPLTQIKDLK